MCIHCPSVWAEFLTICEAARLPPTGTTPIFKTYRQAFLDPAPLTLWALIPSWPLWYRPRTSPRYSITWSPNLGRNLTSPPVYPAPVSVLIDLDTAINPLSIYAGSNTPFRSASKPKPLHFTIGHSGAIFTFRSVEHLRLPDAVDHLVFLYGLLFRLARLKASMALDPLDIMTRLEENKEVKRFHEWLLTAKCLLSHGVEVEIASTVESRFLDPPMDYGDADKAPTSSLSSESSVKTDSGQNNRQMKIGLGSSSPSSEPMMAYGASTVVNQSSNSVKSANFDSLPQLRNVSSQLSLNIDVRNLVFFNPMGILTTLVGIE